MSAFDNSLAEYLTPILSEGDENGISPPKTLDYLRNDVNLNHEINALNEENDDENSLPLSQPRPTR